MVAGDDSIRLSDAFAKRLSYYMEDTGADNSMEINAKVGRFLFLKKK